MLWCTGELCSVQILRYLLGGISEGQMVVLAGWEVLGNVQILHNHSLGRGVDCQGCVFMYNWDHNGPQSRETQGC